jgi:predicted metal-dependent hydrolase
MSTRYPVEVVRSDRRNKTVSARIVEGVIRVRIPAWMTADDEERFVGEVVERIERQRQSHAIDLPARAAVLAARFDLPAPSAIRWVSNQNQRWGSCTTGTGEIRISDRLVGVPPWVLDHVIVHELAHLEVPDHSPAFQALLHRDPLAERAIGYLMALNDGALSDGALNESTANDRTLDDPTVPDDMSADRAG